VVGTIDVYVHREGADRGTRAPCICTIYLSCLPSRDLENRAREGNGQGIGAPCIRTNIVNYWSCSTSWDLENQVI
jgi:hypothetical protein